jgi:hypothetical protein
MELTEGSIKIDPSTNEVIAMGIERHHTRSTTHISQGGTSLQDVPVNQDTQSDHTGH